MTTIETWKRRYERQKGKVGALEQLVEDKTRALFLANEGLREANVTLEQRVSERTAELAEALERAEAASHAKSDFLAQMSHELRTPLHGLLGTVDALSRTRLDERQQRLITQSQRSGQHLLGVIGDILDFSRLEKGHMEMESVPVDVGALTREIGEMFATTATEKGIDLDIRQPAGAIPTVLTDPHRLRQVFSNLVSNAIKFTAEGEVLLRLRCQPSASDAVALVWTVSDTGIGISAEAFERIFEPFTQAEAATTRQFGGTGLGLPIARRIVRAMGGTMGVDSEVGRGTTFTVSLMLSRSDSAPPASAVEVMPATAPAADGRMSGVRILLVDDNPINRMVGEEMLASLGCTVDLAENSEHAISAVQACEPAMILMDCHMPGTTGIETARILRRMGYERPIIALTADVSQENRIAVAEAGMGGLLGKPYRLDQLERLLADTLAHPAAEPVPVPAPAPDPGAEPLLDEALALEAVGGRERIVVRLRTVFLEQLSGSLERLEAAARSGDPVQQRAAAHSLKGAAGTVYAQRLRALAARMEDAGVAGACTPEILPELMVVAGETATLLRQKQAA